GSLPNGGATLVAIGAGALLRRRVPDGLRSVRQRQPGEHDARLSGDVAGRVDGGGHVVAVVAERAVDRVRARRRQRPASTAVTGTAERGPARLRVAARRGARDADGAAPEVRAVALLAG